MIKPTTTFSQEADYAKNLLGERGKPVEDGFEYNSESNTEWLEGEALLKMIQVSEKET